MASGHCTGRWPTLPVALAQDTATESTPTMGLEELVLWLLGVVFPVGVGYWCMTVFRSKGRSAGGGFALGFFLTLFLSLPGAAVALLISYTRFRQLLVRPVSRRPKP